LISSNAPANPSSQYNVDQPTAPKGKVDQDNISMIKKCEHLEEIWRETLHGNGGKISIEVMDKYVIKSITVLDYINLEA
jgi:hypothetical protein